jgi:antitoxin VapB
MRTKLLKRGNDQAVRIPRELRFEPPTDKVEIERVGDALIVRPIEATTRRRLTNVLEKFKAFSPDFTAR